VKPEKRKKLFSWWKIFTTLCSTSINCTERA